MDWKILYKLRVVSREVRCVSNGLLYLGVCIECKFIDRITLWIGLQNLDSQCIYLFQNKQSSVVRRIQFGSKFKSNLECQQTEHKENHNNNNDSDDRKPKVRMTKRSWRNFVSSANNKSDNCRTHLFPLFHTKQKIFLRSHWIQNGRNMHVGKQRTNYLWPN